MTKRIAIFGGSFNPPHIWHRLIVEELARRFAEVIIVPCGTRRDKLSNNDTDFLHRAIMCDRAFRDLPNVRVDLFDLEGMHFTCNDDLQTRYSTGDTEVWHVVGTDLVLPRQDRGPVIRDDWRRGQRIWDELNWFIVARPGFELPEGAALPLHHELCRIDRLVDSSSSEIRHRMFARQPCNDLVMPAVLAYMEQHNLYRGHWDSGISSPQISEARPFIQFDSYSEQAFTIASALQRASVPLEQANIILVVGGDGTMLRAVNKFWRWRLPFIGFNTGHVGYLLNHLVCVLQDHPELLLKAITDQPLISHQLPLLYAQYYCESDKTWQTAYAFNDFWLERAGAAPIIMEVRIHSGFNNWSIEGVMGDGLLMATAAGSTAYAQSMGATPLSVTAPQAWLLIGNNIGRPDGGIRQLPLDRNSKVVITISNTDWRPARLCADTGTLANVSRVHVNMSRTAAAELVFLPGTDLTAKLLDHRFPRR
jgi:nicotinate (nicotinamide) nucleotide adenylyltransferase